MCFGARARFLVFALLLLYVGCREPPPSDHPADAAARQWLALLDAQHYEATWTAGSEWLRLGVSEAGWAKALREVHAQSGDLRGRTLYALRSTRLVSKLPEPGEFAILQYRSEYEKLRGVETLVLRREGEAWRVTGYRVEPRMPWD